MSTSTDIKGVVMSVTYYDGYTRHVVACERAPSCTRPGQYVTLTTDDGTRCYMTIMRQQHDRVEFLVNADTRMSATLNVDTNVMISQPAGGFDLIDVSRHRRVICIASGSGIAGIVPVMETIDELGMSATVVYLESTMKHLQIHKDNICDRVSNCKINYVTTAGYLREHPDVDIVTSLRRLGCHVEFDGSLVYACGSSSFIERLKRDLISTYVQPDMFRINF